MNKKEFIQEVAAKCSTTHAETAKVLAAILETIDQSLAKEEPVVLIGFGTFFIRDRAARKGINPITKASMDLPATKVVRFKVSKKIGK